MPAGEEVGRRRLERDRQPVSRRGQPRHVIGRARAVLLRADDVAEELRPGRPSSKTGDRVRSIVARNVSAVTGSSDGGENM